MKTIISPPNLIVRSNKKGPKSWLDFFISLLFKEKPAVRIIERKTIAIRVRGIVQGVNFRKTCYAKAQELGLKGTVENLSDGSVKIIATGTKLQLKDITDWAKVGPGTAYVTSVEDEPLPLLTFDDFKIIG